MSCGHYLRMNVMVVYLMCFKRSFPFMLLFCLLAPYNYITEHPLWIKWLRFKCSMDAIHISCLTVLHMTITTNRDWVGGQCHEKSFPCYFFLYAKRYNSLSLSLFIYFISAATLCDTLVLTHVGNLNIVWYFLWYLFCYH